MAQSTRDVLRFPASQARYIDPYLPSTQPPIPITQPPKPHTTLTFATSLDSMLSLSPTLPTALSGPQSKAMTHYLRSHHDAILIGVGTAISDDPSLNCRIEGVGGYGGEGLVGQPRPVVIDPSGRWNVGLGSKVVRLAREGRGRAPWIISRSRVDMVKKREILESVGGRILVVASEDEGGGIAWRKILELLVKEGVRSIMVEGGGAVINNLLSPENLDLVDSVIVTIAPVWLGKGGVQVCPEPRVEEGRKVPVRTLKDVKWVPLGDDVVLCGRPIEV